MTRVALPRVGGAAEAPMRPSSLRFEAGLTAAPQDGSWRTQKLARQQSPRLFATSGTHLSRGLAALEDKTDDEIVQSLLDNDLNTATFVEYFPQLEPAPSPARSPARARAPAPAPAPSQVPPAAPWLAGAAAAVATDALLPRVEGVNVHTLTRTPTLTLTLTLTLALTLTLTLILALSLALSLILNPHPRP